MHNEIQFPIRNFVKVFLGIICFFQLTTGLQGQTRPTKKIFDLKRGVNFGNMLEAPNEGDWGLTVQEIFFDKVVEGGFDHIRLPVSWTHHASQTAPYAIDPVFLQRVAWVVDQAEKRQLKIIVNNHHHDELNADPLAEWSRAIAIWRQVSTYFRNRSRLVYFEILNEPHNAFNTNPELWNLFMADALSVIRRTNPDRKVLVGPVFWNSVRALGDFKPPRDANLMATFHFYEPFPFTHQGAEWVSPVPPIGITWSGQRHLIDPEWQNWSWGTTVSESNTGLRVKYDQGWAGFQTYTPTSISQPNQLIINVDKAMNLTIKVGNANQEVFYPLQTTAGARDYMILLSPAIQSVDRIFIQNNSPNPLPEFVLSRMIVKGAIDRKVINTELGAIQDAFLLASNWSKRTGVPVHLGEFGAYSPADMNSRVAWTAAVRSTAENAGIPFSYWEFGAGFGVYDPVLNLWRVPLMRALNPEF